MMLKPVGETVREERQHPPTHPPYSQPPTTAVSKATPFDMVFLSLVTKGDYSLWQEPEGSREAKRARNSPIGAFLSGQSDQIEILFGPQSSLPYKK